VHNDLAKAGKRWLQTVPKPPGEIFEGGILQTFDVIEHLMIEPAEERLHGSRNLRMVEQPALALVHLARNAYLNAEGMAVYTSAFVLFWHAGQLVRRLETKCFAQLNVHPPFNIQDSIIQSSAYKG
jgi:hypothetical protein